MKHILVIRFSSLGDVLLQKYFLKALRKDYGSNVEISFLTLKDFKSILENDPSIDNLYCVDREKGFKGLLNLHKEVRKIYKFKPFDLIIDLHNSLRSRWLKLCFYNVWAVTIDKRIVERFLLVKTKYDFYRPQKVESLVERNLLDLKSSLNLSSNIYDVIEKERVVKGQKKISIMASAANETKRWPLDSFFRLIEKMLNSDTFLEYKFVILGGPADDFLKKLEVLETKYNQRVRYLQGKTSIEETKEIISESSFLIGNDTGLCHIAESYGVPVLMLMGPTHERFGFIPINPKSTLLTNNVNCRPCHHTGAKTCVKSEAYCLTNISVDEVFDSCEKMEKSL